MIPKSEIRKKNIEIEIKKTILRTCCLFLLIFKGKGIVFMKKVLMTHDLESCLEIGIFFHSKKLISVAKLYSSQCHNKRTLFRIINLRNEDLFMPSDEFMF